MTLNTKQKHSGIAKQIQVILIYFNVKMETREEGQMLMEPSVMDAMEVGAEAHTEIPICVAIVDHGCNHF